MHPESRQGGFTLIEVVVAMAIIALGMMAVFRVVQDTVNNATYLRDRSFATWIADNRLVEMRLATALPSVDITSGEVEFANQNWRWTATVSQTPVDNLRRIDVRVRRASDPDDRVLGQVSGFVGQVAMSTPPATLAWAGTAEADEGDGGNDGASNQPGNGNTQPSVGPRPVRRSRTPVEEE
jgi:general secretion pathway protein I